MDPISQVKSTASLNSSFTANVDMSDIKSTEKELRQFLAALPKKLGYENQLYVEANVYKACYYALCGKGELTEEVFGANNTKNAEVPIDLNWDPLKIDPHLKFSGATSERHSHAKGQACARILKDGEFLFRCNDCFYDSSCILCEDCYNSADHVGHRVLKYTAMGGGMCDCGDESAFLRKLTCPCLQSSDEVALSSNLTSRLYLVLSVVIGYIVDVGNMSIQELPEVAAYLEKNTTADTYLDFFERTTLPYDKYGDGDQLRKDEDIKWDLFLTEYENRTARDANDLVEYCDAIDVFTRRRLMEEIGQYGKPTLITSSDLASLIQQQKAAEQLTTVTLIRPSRDSMREKMVLFLLKWVENLMCCEWNFALKTISKAVAAEILLDTPENFLQMDVFQGMGLDDNYCFLPGFTTKDLYEGRIFSYNPKNSLSGYSTTLMENFAVDFDSHDVEVMLRLLTYELRFPGDIRKRIDNLLIQSLMHDQKYKDKFATSFLRSYPALLYLTAIANKDAPNSCLQSISVQVFMCPPTNNSVLQSKYPCNLIVPVIQIIESYFSRENSFGYRNITNVSDPQRRLPHISKIHNALNIGMDTIDRVFTKNDSNDTLNLLFREETLLAFVAYISLFQSIGEIKRVVGNHVEEENYEFYNFLAKTGISPLPLVRAINKVKILDTKVAVDALKVIMSMTGRESNNLWFSMLPVTQKPTYFFNPLQFLICTVMRHLDVSSVSETIQLNMNLWKGIYDSSLQSIVLASQVKIGTWVRNGELVAEISSLYFSELADISYYSDFHLVQIAALFEDPDVFFEYLLGRWELVGWMSDEVSHKETVYEDKFGFACEQFIIFMYNLLAERYYFDECDKQKEAAYIVGKSLTYRLAEGPQSFSSLWRKSKRRGMSIETFTDILKDHADYFPPQGLTDTGIYRLKPELLEKVDLIGLFLDSGLSQSTFLLLIESIAKHKRVDPSRVCLHPRIHFCKNAYVNSNMGNFLRTKLFSKFSYKLLQLGLNEKEESILTPLLHLIHAILVDDEKNHGKTYINEYFLQYSICNSLLSIVDASISPTVSAKAEFILDTLILKDENIIQSLSLCFGEMHIRNYRERKRDKTDKKRKRSKDAVEARKAKILLKFAKQRQTFMEQNSFEDDGKCSDEKLHKNKCVACGEKETIDEAVCLPFALSHQAIAWYLPPRGPYFQFAFKNYWDLPGPDALYKFEARKASDKKQYVFPRSKKKCVELPYTCLHYVHKKCCVVNGDKGLFVCPLCNQQFGKVLPTYYCKEDSLIPTKWLEGEPKTLKYFDLCAQLSVEKNDEFLRSIIHLDYFENDRLKEGIETPTYDPFELHEPDAITVFDHTKKISVLLANSIKSYEISARLDGVKGMSNFIDSFPSSAIFLCRSLIQNRVMLFNKVRMETSTMKFEECAKKYWSFNEFGDDHFSDTIDSFFLTGETLQTHFRAGLARMVIDSLKKIYDNCCPFTLDEQVEVSEDIIMGVAAALYSLSDDIEIHEEQAGYIYQALQKLVIPFLRQCVMLRHVFTCSKTGENEYMCLEEFEELHEYNDQWSTSRYITLLCKCLNIPDLDEIFRSMNQLNSYERQVMEDVRNALPSKSGEGLIAFPNVQRIIQMPKSFLEVRSADSTPYKTSFICLHCSECVLKGEKTMHLRECAKMGLFFCLSLNSVYVQIDETSEAHLPGPYMTEHGEVKLDNIPGEAELNEKRYLYLNKIWLNNELFGVACRSKLHYVRRLFGLDLLEQREEEEDEDNQRYDVVVDLDSDFFND